jgi:prepilin-type N-terminal cleavage/methylation domain-containing protein
LPTSTAPPTRSRRAFSLLELTVTLGVVALVAALVMPRLHGRQAGSLRVAADTAAQRLTAARWRAMVDGRDVVVPLADLASGLQVVHEGRADVDTLTFTPLPTALVRTIVLTDTAGAQARLTIPPGLAPLAIAYVDPS